MSSGVAAVRCGGSMRDRQADGARPRVGWRRCLVRRGPRRSSVTMARPSPAPPLSRWRAGSARSKGGEGAGQELRRESPGRRLDATQMSGACRRGARRRARSCRRVGCARALSSRLSTACRSRRGSPGREAAGCNGSTASTAGSRRGRRWRRPSGRAPGHVVLLGEHDRGALLAASQQEQVVGEPAQPSSLDVGVVDGPSQLVAPSGRVARPAPARCAASTAGSAARGRRRRQAGAPGPGRRASAAGGR